METRRADSSYNDRRGETAPPCGQCGMCVCACVYREQRFHLITSRLQNAQLGSQGFLRLLACRESLWTPDQLQENWENWKKIIIFHSRVSHVTLRKTALPVNV